MALGFAGGLAAFMNGYTQGEQQNHDRARQKSEDDWVKSQRERAMADNKRQDDLREKMAKYDRTATVETEQAGPGLEQPDGSEAAMPTLKSTRIKTDAEQLNDYADMQQGTDPSKAFELRGKAKELTAKDYANKFMQFRDSARDLPVKDQVDTAVSIFNDAPNPGMIRIVNYDDKTGAGTYEGYNKATGQRVTRAFSDPKQFINDLHSFVAPEQYQAERAAATARAQKQEDELNKPYTLTHGSKRMVRDRVMGDNPRDGDGQVNVGTDENPQWVSGGGKKGKSLLEQTRAVLDESKKKSDMTPEVSTLSDHYADKVVQANPNITPGTAAHIAATAAADVASGKPQFVKLRVNELTGEVNQVYKNPLHEGGKPFVLGRGVTDFASYAKTLSQEDVQQVGQTVLGAMNEATQKVFLEAAKDPAKLKALQESIAKRTDLTPELKEANIAALTNRVNILSMYTPAAAAATPGAPSAGAGTKFKPAGGADPAGYNFMLAGRVKYLLDKQRGGISQLTPQEAVELKQRLAAKAAQEDPNRKPTGWFGEDLGQ